MLKKEKSDDKLHFYCIFLTFWSKRLSFSVILGQLLPEVPSLDVVVEMDAIGAAELGQNIISLLRKFDDSKASSRSQGCISALRLLICG